MDIKQLTNEILEREHESMREMYEAQHPGKSFDEFMRSFEGIHPAFDHPGYYIDDVEAVDELEGEHRWQRLESIVRSAVRDALEKRYDPWLAEFVAERVALADGED